jgi:hypothetical protein
MEPGLRIKFLWHDTDVVGVSIAASNGEFSGVSRAYIDRDDPRVAALILSGFPRTLDDSREFSFGTMDPQFAGGGAQLRFLCKDGSGHAAVEIYIACEAEPKSNRWSRPPQLAHFLLMWKRQQLTTLCASSRNSIRMNPVRHSSDSGRADQGPQA